MFDGILGRGFAPKGKPLIKLTKNRIDVLRRKRNATVKFLKKDLADLIINGLDVNAYSRAGGLLDELRHLWNIEFVEKTCDFIYNQLSTMQKNEECPEDCREAVSSLMFAASGFSELPELRELRQMFHEKYADSLGVFVNQELVKNMSSKSFSLEKKVKLMEDVALEFSINWDSKAFEKRIVRHNTKETQKSTQDKYKSVDGQRDPLFQSDKASYWNGLRVNPHALISNERSDNVHKAERKKEEPSRERHNKPIFNEGDTIVMKIKRENLVQGNGVVKKTEVIASERKEPSRERHEPLFTEGDTIVMKVKGENGVVDSHKKTEATATSEKPKHRRSKTVDKLIIGFRQESFLTQKVEENTSKPPKPISKSVRTKSIDRGSRENLVLMGESKGDDANPERKVDERETTERMKYKLLPPPPYVKPSGKPKDEKTEASVPKDEKAEASGHPEITKNVSGAEKRTEAGHHRQVSDTSLKRRTSRRKHNIHLGGDETTRSRESESSRKGEAEDEKDNEEKMMDKLLMHYSKKPSSYEKKEESKNRREEEMRVKQHARSRSLPPGESSELVKTFARASSYQPERSSEANKHVHPKLPDYDDLAARFAELKGR